MPIMPRYEAYKDSGVDWIGEIPGHWDKMRLKFTSVTAKVLLIMNESSNI